MRNKIIIILFILLSSCSTNFIQISDNYKDIQFNNELLSIQFVPSEIKIEKKLSSILFNNDFSSDSSFITFFKNELLFSAKKTFNSNNISFTNQIRSFEIKTLKTNNGKIKLLFPSLKDKEHKNMLFLEEFVIDYNQGNFLFLPSSYFLSFLNNSDELILSTKFLLWDFHYARYISYGKLSIKTEISSGKLKEGINKALDKLFVKVFKYKNI